MYLLSPPSKQKLIKLLSTIRSLLCGNLAYSVEKSKVERGVAFLRLLSPFIASITGLLLCNVQKVLTPVKNLHLSFYVCICLKSKQKIDFIVLAKGFIEDLGDPIINLALIGFLCILGTQYILGNRLFSIGMLSIPNLIFKSLIFHISHRRYYSIPIL